MKNIFSHLFSLVLLLGFAFLVSYLIYGWAGYPRGWDANVHIFQLKLIQQFWPHIWWLPVWAGGMAFFTWYPVVFPYAVMASFANLFHVSAEFTLNFMTVFSAGILAFGLYLIINRLTGKFLLPLFLAMCLVATPALWGWSFESGLYERFFALAPFSLALWAFISYLQEKNNRHNFLFTVFFIGLTFAIQGLTGFVLLLVLLYWGLIYDRNLWDAIGSFVKVAIPGFLLSAFEMLPPVILGFPGFPFSAPAKLAPQGNVAYLRDLLFLIRPGNQIVDHYSFQIPYLWTLQPVLVSVFLLSMILLAFCFVRRKIPQDLSGKFILGILMLVGGLTVYTMVLFPFLGLIYGGIWLPKWLLPFLAFFALILAGVINATILESRRLVLNVISLLGMGLLLLWLFLQFPLSSPMSRAPFERPLSRSELFQNMQLQDTPRYRFGTGDYGRLAVWFNILYPHLPQTRDYCANCITDPNAYFYFQQTIWHQKNNLNEALFLLDWWAVDKFLVSQTDDYQKFSAENIPIKSLGENRDFKAFEYLKPEPILSVVTVPTALVITGGRAQFDIIFRALARANVNSSKLLPLQGGTNLSGYNLEELKKFNLIILYEAKFKDQMAESKLIEQYLAAGGNVYIEGNPWGDRPLPVFLPVKKLTAGELKGDWGLSAPFGSTTSGESPWKVQLGSDLVKNSRILLTSKDRPLVVAGNWQRGKVVWSGMNLPYYLDQRKNLQETELLTDIYLALTGEPGREINYEARFPNPESREIEIKADSSRGGGVLLRELTNGNWGALINGRTARIYRAGPGFMYVPLAKAQAGDKITFQYSLGPVEKLGYLVSIATFLALLFWFLGKRQIHLKMHPLKGISQWWDKEGE